MWKLINQLSGLNHQSNMPSGDEFVKYFKDLPTGFPSENFEYDYEKKALHYLNMVKSEPITRNPSSIDFDILNRNFTKEELISCISHLKNGK